MKCLECEHDFDRSHPGQRPPRYHSKRYPLCRFCFFVEHQTVVDRGHFKCVNLVGSDECNFINALYGKQKIPEDHLPAICPKCKRKAHWVNVAAKRLGL